jgi:hypothetical protein
LVGQVHQDNPLKPIIEVVVALVVTMVLTEAKVFGAMVVLAVYTGAVVVTVYKVPGVVVVVEEETAQ